MENKIRFLIQKYNRRLLEEKSDEKKEIYRNIIEDLKELLCNI